MKYGKFVAKGFEVFTEEEIRAFEQKFKRQVSAFAHEKAAVSVTIHKADLSKPYSHDFMEVCFQFPKIEGMRNATGDRILFFSKVTFFVEKEVGYLDTWDWSKGAPKDESYKDYQNAPEFQYQANMYTNGRYIPYKCRRECFIDEKDSFQYGTEIDDINFNNSLNYLFNRKLKNLH